MVSGSKDKTLILWDVDWVNGTGILQRQLTGHADAGIISVAFNPNAPIIAFGSEFIDNAKTQGIISLWDMDTGEIQELRDNNGQVYSYYSVTSLSFNHNGNQLLAGSSGYAMVLWDLELNMKGNIEPKAHLHTGWPVKNPNAALSVAFSPDGHFGVSGSGDSNIYLWDMATNKVIFTYIGHEQPVNAVAFSPDGTKLLSASDDRTLRLWDTLPSAELHLYTGELYGDVGMSPDGKTVLSGNESDHLLRLWQVANSKVQIFPAPPNTFWAIAISRDGKRALTGSVDKNVYLWDLAQRKQLQTLRGHPGSVTSVAFSPDGLLALSGSYPGPAPTKDTKGILILWNLTTGKIVHLDGHTDVIHSVAFSPNSQIALSASDDGKIILWDIKTGKQIRTFVGHLGAVRSVAFSSNGQNALSSSTDKTLILWNVMTGEQIRVYRGHTNEVNSVAFLRNDTIALSSSLDGTMRLWDLATGAQLARWIAHVGGVQHSEITDDGTLALSMGVDQTLRLWKVDVLTDPVKWVQDNRYVRELTADERRLYGLDGLAP